MPPLQIPVHRLDLIERELSNALSEYPNVSALDRLKFVRSLVCVMRSQTDMDEDATIPVLDLEVQSSKEYPER